jgi:hypothetical protein
LLTETVREGFPDPGAMAISIGACSLGVIAVTAGNPLTLALVWAALDLSELVAVVASGGSRTGSQRIVTAFCLHAVAIVLLMLAQVISSTSNKPQDFALASSGAGLLFVAAAGLRLGVLPLQLPYIFGPSLRRGVGTTLGAASAAASLILFSRVPSASAASWLSILILILSAVAALYAGWMWLRAPDELAGRPFWMIGLAGLALFSALRGNPVGAAAWGVALILTGSALFLSSVQHVWLNRLLFIGAWELSSLPFSLTAAGWGGESGITLWVAPIFVVTQAFLLAGLIRHAGRPAARTPLQAQPAWTRSVYPAGIGLLLLVPLVLGFIGWDGALQVGAIVPGIIAALLSAGLLWAVPRFRILNPVPAHWLQPAFATSRLDRLTDGFLGVYRWLGRISLTISNVLEGEAGLMWSLLFLVIFILLIVQRNP